MITSVPLEAQRQGDFSGLLDATGKQIPIYDPSGTSLARTQFPSNRIPLTRFDSAAAAITALLPLPNQLGSNGQPLPFNNYAVTRTSTSAVNSFDVRVDHQFSSKDTVFARDSFQNTGVVVPSLLGLPLGGTITGAGNTQARNQNAGIGQIYQFTPSVTTRNSRGLETAPDPGTDARR